MLTAAKPAIIRIIALTIFSLEISFIKNRNIWLYPQAHKAYYTYVIYHKLKILVQNINIILFYQANQLGWSPSCTGFKSITSDGYKMKYCSFVESSYHWNSKLSFQQAFQLIKWTFNPIFFPLNILSPTHNKSSTRRR
jgi:hypothetical protein